MRYECEDCGSVFYETEVKAWRVKTNDEKCSNPLCPFCESKYVKG